MSKLGETFTYTQKYYDTFSKLDKETAMKINWDFCYYCTHEFQFPDDVHPLTAAFVESFKALLEGAEDYKSKQSERGKLGGRPELGAIDDEIRGAIRALCEQNRGRKPTEKEVKDYCGISLKSIRDRQGWKDRDKIYSEINDVENVDENVENLQESTTTSFMF